MAFYQTLTGQERATAYGSAVKEIEEVIRVLRERERQGEGAPFDRIRTEGERAELLAELELVRAEAELNRARMLAFLPPTLLRLSVGIEAIEDLWADLDQAFALCQLGRAVTERSPERTRTSLRRLRRASFTMVPVIGTGQCDRCQTMI